MGKNKKQLEPNFLDVIASASSLELIGLMMVLSILASILTSVGLNTTPWMFDRDIFLGIAPAESSIVTNVSVENVPTPEVEENFIYKFNKLETPHSEIRLGEGIVGIEYDYYISNTSGSSMYPSISYGDIILMRIPKNNNEIKEGFNVECKYYEDGVWHDILHRVVGVYPDFVLTQGDRNYRADDHWCKYDEIKGYEVAIIKGGEIINED